MSIGSLVVEYFKRHHGIIVGNALCTILANVFVNIITPRVLAHLLSHLDEPALLPTHTFRLFVCWVLTQLLYCAANEFYDRINVSLDKFINDRLLQQVLIRMDQHPESVNLSLVTNVIDTLRENLNNVLYYISVVIPRIIILFISSLALLTLHRLIGSICLVMTMGILVMFVRVLHSSHTNESLDQHQRVLDTVHDSFLNIHTIRSTDQGINMEMNKISDLTSHHARLEKSQFLAIRQQQWVFYGINAMVFGYFLYLMYRNAVKKETLSEDTSTLILSITPLFSQFTDLLYYLPEFSKGFHLVAYHDTWVKDMCSYSLPPPMSLTTPLLYSLEHVTYGYPQTEPIFQDLSLRIPSGFTWIKGESGSGKSTFIKLLLGVETPVQGSVQMNEQPVTTMIKQHVVYLHQQAVSLFTTTIWNNIMYGQHDPSTVESRLYDLIDTYALHTVFGAKEGERSFLEQSVGKHGEHLSGGQKQMVHLLRCILLDRSMYIMDEPLSGLDPDTKSKILSMVEHLVKQGKTILMISHDPVAIPRQHILQFIKGQNPTLMES